MDKIVLTAQTREPGSKHAAKLRASGQVPGVAYGHGAEPTPVALESKELERVYHQTGGNKIVGLKIDDHKAKNVIIYDVQREAVKGNLTHADFYVVRMDEELHAEVPLHFVGESTAVYQGEGSLMKNLEALEVACLPANLPEAIEVDISVLDDFEKTITVADLKIPEGVRLTIEDTDTLVARVEAPRSDEEMAELDETVAAELPEGVAEEQPIVVSEENEGDKDRRDKK
jgi:large subunit ribosomal protein L25